jgi:phage terminase large subunit-like protein
LTNSKSSEWVRNKNDELAIDRGYYFDLAAAERVRKFFNLFLRHSKGQFAKQAFELIDWQWRGVVAPAFGWMRPNGLRRFSRVGVGIPKKNGKSTLLAGIGLYLLSKDNEPGAEVYSAATDRDQASIIFNESATMVASSPALAKRLTIRDSRKTIYYHATNSLYRALSSDANKKEGYNAHGILFDELHAQEGRELWDVLEYAGASRRQSMLWWISTAGELDETLLWWEQWQYCKRVASGEIEDLHTLGVIYEPDPGDDWKAESTWFKANPSLGITIPVENFREECERAQHNPAAASAFKRRRLNIATIATSEWLAPEVWQACGKKYTLRQLRKKRARCVGALDLASTTDLIALVLLFKIGELVYLWPVFWVPQRAVDDRERSNRQRYDQWIEQGYLKVTSTEPVADYNVIRKDTMKLSALARPERIVIDRWNATQLAYNLRKSMRNSDLDTKIEFATANFRTLSSATKEFERLLLSKKIRHPNNPVMNWMFSNVIIQQDAAGNRRPDKSKSKDKIDGILAAILGLAALLDCKDKPTLETDGLQNVGEED